MRFSAKLPAESVGGLGMSYNTKLALLTTAIFVGLSLAVMNIISKIGFLLSMPAE